MADNFLQFSEVLTALTDQEHAWLREQVQYIYVVGDREYTVDDLPADFSSEQVDWEGYRVFRSRNSADDEYTDFEFSFDKNDDGSRDLWLYATESGSPEQVAFLVQQFLRRFRPEQCWSLTYAETCSKPRIGEFGGGAVFVTAGHVDFANARDFIEEQRARFAARNPTHPTPERSSDMSTLLDDVPTTSRTTTSSSARLRSTMAAVRIAFTWFGVRKTLTAEQKAQAADAFGAEGEFLSAGKKLLDTRHPAFKAVTAIRGRMLSFWKGISLPYPEPGIRLIRQDDLSAFDVQMTTLKAELAEAVANLDDHYGELRSAARGTAGAAVQSGRLP